MNRARYWTDLAGHSPLAMLLDFDGTLVALAPRIEVARPEPSVISLLERLAALPGVLVAVVSGRSRRDLEQYFVRSPASLILVAEHGAYLRSESAWRALTSGVAPRMDDLCSVLERLARQYPGAWVERKEWGVAFHVREVSRRAVAGLRVEVEVASHSWLSAHPDYEIVAEAEVLEIRPVAARKSVVVSWIRERAGSACRIIAVGDDVTDEDMFGAVKPSDAAILVTPEARSATSAHWAFRSPVEVSRFLQWIEAARTSGSEPADAILPRPLSVWLPSPPNKPAPGLLAVSNRLPQLRELISPDDGRGRPVGGLVGALQSVLSNREGLWLGCSGRTVPDDSVEPIRIDGEARPPLAWVDLPATVYDRYYNGFCNQSLWPLLHTLPGRVRFEDADWHAYEGVNRRLAEAAVRLVPPECTIWAHDYHVLLLAAGLRSRGHRGPIGLFLHVPFPGVDMFSVIPWAGQLLEALLAFDLVGLQTAADVRNLHQVVGALSDAAVSDGGIEHGGRRTRVEAFPIGIGMDAFEIPPEQDADEDTAGLLRSVAGRQLVLGVDRLDYTKGIPERLEAFARLFELFPEWRGKVSLVQISVPSRADVTHYREQRRRIEAAVGRINGELGEAHWTPVRYLYRSYERHQLSRFYGAADVCLVTPLRDGMNLVAKEFVAAQDSEDPGVLVLSRFAGAAAELADAILTNPFHVEGMARHLDQALRMETTERRGRHQKLLRAVHRTTAISWAEDFLGVLETCREARPEVTPMVGPATLGDPVS